MLYTQVKQAIQESDKDTVREILDTYNEEVLQAALDCGIPVNDIMEAYQGEWSSDADFVQNLVEDCGDIPKDLPAYIHIDWERTAHDIMMDYSEEKGHYFRNL